MLNKAEARTEVKEDVNFNIRADSNAVFSKQWEDSYFKLYRPWIESIKRLSDIICVISRGEADTEAYKEFYNLWVDTYKEIYGKNARSVELNGEIFDNFVESTDIYLVMYKSWISALEKMSEKAKEMSLQTSDPQAFKEFNIRWLKMYEMAFESFFEDMPTVGGPMKEAMEPVKIMSKMYADTFIKMSKMWIRSDSGSATAYLGKNKR
jgi:hypothetical protein